MSETHPNTSYPDSSLHPFETVSDSRRLTFREEIQLLFGINKAVNAFGFKTPRHEVKGALFTPLAMAPQSSLFLILYLLVLRVAARDCTGLQSLKLSNAAINNAVHLSAGTTFSASADPTCYLPTYNNTVALCRVSGIVNTSSTSSVEFEMWLPDTWYGRVLTVGNGGLGGCKHFFYDLSLV